MARLPAPNRGDIVMLDFDPQTGHEQALRRPALVLTDASFNARVGLCIVCPVTSRAKGRPFEVEVPPGLGVKGVVLVEHVKSLDWMERNAKFKAVAPSTLLDEVLDVLADLLQM